MLYYIVGYVVLGLNSRGKLYCAVPHARTPRHTSGYPNSHGTHVRVLAEFRLPVCARLRGKICISSAVSSARAYIRTRMSAFACMRVRHALKHRQQRIFTRASVCVSDGRVYAREGTNPENTSILLSLSLSLGPGGE